MKSKFCGIGKGFALMVEPVSRICLVVVSIFLSGALVGCGNSIPLEKAASEYWAVQEQDANARAFNSVEEMEANEELREAKAERKEMRRK